MPERAARGAFNNPDRLPPDVREAICRSGDPESGGRHLAEGRIHRGDARRLLARVRPGSVALGVWSPPYFVGKGYEADLDFDDWCGLLSEVIALHGRALAPGAFLVVNIADILCYRDPGMPRIQADAVGRKRSPVTREDVERAMREHPGRNRRQLAGILGCSEQTIDRRLNGNNIRGGKHAPQTRVRLVGGLVEGWALDAGLYPYDRRIWVKDPAWESSRWASLSYRSVDEFEYLYFFWRPGVTRLDRSRLSDEEWRRWGSRAVWSFPSVRANDDHEAKFPLELPRRVVRLLTDPGDLVLDCFAGSGTTAVAAVLEGRSFLGIERSEEYCALARRNVRAARRRRGG